MRLGISSYTYVWSVGVPGYPSPASPMTAFELLDKAVQLGVSVVQIADNLPLHRLRKVEIKDLSQRAKQLDIEIEVGTRGISSDRLLTYLSLATRFASPIVRVVVDTEAHESSTDAFAGQPSINDIVEALANVADEFERAGVRIAIENHDRLEAKTLLGILDRVGSDQVGICFDTANSIGCLESPEIIIDTLGPRIWNLHIKDFCIRRPPHNKGFVVEGRAAGQGQLDIPRILRRLSESNRDFNAILELWPPPQASLEATIALENAWAEESVRFLRQLIAD